jgi:hypothetical protein
LVRGMLETHTHTRTHTHTHTHTQTPVIPVLAMLRGMVERQDPALSTIGYTLALKKKSSNVLFNVSPRNVESMFSSPLIYRIKRRNI